MKLKTFRHLWGYELRWDQTFPAIKDRGYVGIEAVLPNPDEEARLIDLLTQHRLEFIATVHTHGVNVADHLLILRQHAERAKRLGARFVAAQAGSDAFDASEVSKFYTGALKIEADIGIVIAHETHRARPLFHPWSTGCILEEFPALKIVCDFSHWVCVCERLLEDASAIIEKVAEQAHHIHARVGYAQGPQVPDPRENIYRNEVVAHERWWDVIWDSQEQRGLHESTICPEFGPSPYLSPHTHEPAKFLESVVEWQRERQVTRFATRRTPV